MTAPPSRADDALLCRRVCTDADVTAAAAPRDDVDDDDESVDDVTGKIRDCEFSRGSDVVVLLTDVV